MVRSVPTSQKMFVAMLYTVGYCCYYLKYVESPME